MIALSGIRTQQGFSVGPGGSTVALDVLGLFHAGICPQQGLSVRPGSSTVAHDVLEVASRVVDRLTVLSVHG